MSDLDALAASTSGKIEIEMLDDGRDSQVLDRIIKSAVLEVVPGAGQARDARDRLSRRSRTARWCTPAKTFPPPSTASSSTRSTGSSRCSPSLGVGESPAACASGIEFVLEGLHLTKRLNKDALGGRATYRARG